MKILLILAQVIFWIGKGGEKRKGIPCGWGRGLKADNKNLTIILVNHRSRRKPTTGKVRGGLGLFNFFRALNEEVPVRQLLPGLVPQLFHLFRLPLVLLLQHLCVSLSPLPRVNVKTLIKPLAWTTFSQRSLTEEKDSWTFTELKMLFNLFSWNEITELVWSFFDNFKAQLSELL